MKKELTVILDTDKARNSLSLHGNFAALHKDSDEEITEKAIEHVGKFASKFGFEMSPKQAPLNADVEKVMTVNVNTKIARKMLQIAGYHDVDSKSDEEIFAMALSMNDCYGVSYEESED